MTPDGYLLPEEEGTPPLVEALARRIFAFSQWRNFDYKFAAIDWMEADREYYRALARECVRQMEWNFRRGTGTAPGSDDSATIAPDDWRPS